jgi:2-polyprenyl-3-methyl-5-hydroxy-6-metoxy-1,4-benzoquinol methylase
MFRSSEGPPERATEEAAYWNTWNSTWRSRADCDPFMERQREIAVAVARELRLDRARILDMGCGTGWLGNALTPFGEVWGADLSPSAIEEGRSRHPAVNLVCGDFLTVPIPGPFDLVVTADGLAHMTDHRRCIDRVASLMTTGGMLLLMTENTRVWTRRSKLRPLPDTVPHARPEEWPSLETIRRILQSAFVIERVGSIEPGGDTGILWWVENYYVARIMNRVAGRVRWRSVLERVGLGREWIIVARRR